jgi:hypothetical protein
MHRFQQGVVLIVSWCKLQEHRLFHVLSRARLREVVKWIGLPNPSPKQGTLFIPRINDEGFQAVLDVTKVRQASGQLLLLVRDDRFY